MKGLFIINPSSGRQNFMDKIKSIMGNLIFENICNAIDVFFTQKKDDALNKAASLKKGEYDFVVAVGGDGTLNEVIHGIVQGQNDIPVAVISAGTVNDFANYLQLPQEVDSFCELIKEYRLKDVDVGKVNDRYFINVVAAGLMSDVGFKVEKDKKAVLGKMAYYVEGAMDFPKQLNKIFNMRFHLDDRKTFESEVLLFLVTNSRSVGGFKTMAPLASTSDGMLDVVIIKNPDILQVAPLALSILSGNHVNHPSVEYYQTKKITIDNLSGEEISIDYDGEELESGWPVNIEIIPAGVKIIVPDYK